LTDGFPTGSPTINLTPVRGVIDPVTGTGICFKWNHPMKNYSKICAEKKEEIAGRLVNET
jgi:hypothetical protein